MTEHSQPSFFLRAGLAFYAVLLIIAAVVWVECEILVKKMRRKSVLPHEPAA